MAQIELRLSNKIQRETGLSEVMVCLRYSHKDLSAKSEVFVNPDFFEYYIDRKKTVMPKKAIPANKNTVRLAFIDLPVRRHLRWQRITPSFFDPVIQKSHLPFRMEPVLSFFYHC